MYLHLGQNTVVAEDNIVGIFDLDNTTWSHITRKYLSNAEKEGALINVSDDIPKSFIICDKKKHREKNAEKTVYLSQLSSQTLLRRAETTQLFTGKESINVRGNK